MPTYSLSEASEIKIVLSWLGEVPDTTHPLLIGGPTLRPARMAIVARPDAECFWQVCLVQVSGLKLLANRALSRREYDLTFHDPLDPAAGAPEWLRDIAQDWSDRINTGGALRA